MNNQNQNNNTNINPAMNFNFPNQAEHSTPEQSQTPVGNQTLGSVVSSIPTAESVNPQPINPNPEPQVNIQTLSSVVSNIQPVQNSNQPNSIPANPSTQINKQSVNQANTELGGTVPSQQLPPDEKIKKKTSPIVVVALILLLLVIGGGLLYYFVLDTPKRIFNVAFNNLYEKVKSESKPANLKYTNYDLSLNAVTNNEKYKPYTELINNIKINATSGLNDNNQFILNGMINYNDGELLNINLLYENNTSYLKVSNLLDKAIKIDLSKDEDEENYNPDFNTDDYNQIVDSVLNAYKSSLEKANYKKELVSLDGKKVKKFTLKIDGAFIESLYSNLSNDQGFLTNLSKITNKSTNEIVEEINKAVNEYENNDEEVSIYTALLNNKFIKLVFISDKNQLSITPNGDIYNYEIMENNKITYKGYVKYNKIATNSNLTFNIMMQDELTTITFNCSTIAVDNIEPLDISNAIDYESLTQEDYAKIQENANKNQTFQTFLNDIGMNEKDLTALTA